MSQSNRAWPEPSSASISRSSLRRAAAIRSCSAAAMRLRVCASRPISLPVRTSVRCSKRPSPSRRASALSWRSGRAIRRATQAARTRPIASMPRPSSRLSRALALGRAERGIDRNADIHQPRHRAGAGEAGDPGDAVEAGVLGAAPALGEAAQQQGALHRRGLADPALGLERAADHPPLGVDQRDHAAGRRGSTPGRAGWSASAAGSRPRRRRRSGRRGRSAGRTPRSTRRPSAGAAAPRRRRRGCASRRGRKVDRRRSAGPTPARPRTSRCWCRRAPTARRRSGWRERSAPGDAASRRCARGRLALDRHGGGERMQQLGHVAEVLVEARTGQAGDQPDLLARIAPGRAPTGAPC